MLVCVINCSHSLGWGGSVGLSSGLIFLRRANGAARYWHSLRKEPIEHNGLRFAILAKQNLQLYFHIYIYMYIWQRLDLLAANREGSVDLQVTPCHLQLVHFAHC